MRLDDLLLYQECLTFEKKIYELINTFEPFEKDTTGKPFLRTSDSISSNIASGYGRYNFKDKKYYCYVSRGNLLETKGWLIKSKERGLIQEELFNELIEFAEKINRMLNAYIKSIGRKKENSSNNKNTDYKQQENSTEEVIVDGNAFTADEDDFFKDL